MQKSFFNNNAFKIILIVILSSLFLWNLYTYFLWKNTSTIFMLILQLTILILIISEHKYAKICIKIWSVLIILGTFLSFIGKTIKTLLENSFEYTYITDNALDIIFLIIGCLIFYFNNKTVEIKELIN